MLRVVHGLYETVIWEDWKNRAWDIKTLPNLFEIFLDLFPSVFPLGFQVRCTFLWKLGPSDIVSFSGWGHINQMAFLLRLWNLLWATSKHDVYLMHNYSIIVAMLWRGKVLNVAGPIVSTVVKISFNLEHLEFVFHSSLTTLTMRSAETPWISINERSIGQCHVC